MENSASYVALEAMMQKGWIIMSFTELEDHFDLLEQKGLISVSEHQALLELAKKLGVDKLDDRAV
jgi:hypothetical protein